MALFDLSPDELVAYRPDVAEPADFDAFWRATLDEARTHELDVRLEKVGNHLTLIDTYDVTFAGFGGTPVKAWLQVPAGTTTALPTVVHYHGYSGGRGYPFAETSFAQAGYAQLILDTRGQGWSTPAGADAEQSVDADTAAGLPGVPGVMTKGILDPAEYYYRRLFTDVVRTLEAAREIDLVDASRLVVLGGSQGGGMSIAAAGLAPMAGIELLGALPDVPFLCHFARAVEITDSYPYKEVSTYLAMFPDRVERAYATLSYFDGVNFAKRARCPALFSVALMDQICPPSTVYAAYNAWGHDDKDIRVYLHNGHEGGRESQHLARLLWLEKHLGAVSE